MVFLSDNGLAGGWGTVLCRDTACIMIKPLFAWLLLCASLCIVQIKNSLRPGQSWLRSLRLSAPPQPKSSVPFYVLTSSLFVSLPEVFGHHFPSVSLSHSLSLPFYSFSDGRVFHPWCVLNDSPSVWQWFDMSRCYINPLSSRMLKGSKQDKEGAPVSRSNTPRPTHSQNQFHYDHGLICPSVPDRRSTIKKEVPGSKSYRQSLHPFPCLRFTSEFPLWAALCCW